MTHSKFVPKTLNKIECVKQRLKSQLWIKAEHFKQLYTKRILCFKYFCRRYTTLNKVYICALQLPKINWR